MELSSLTTEQRAIIVGDEGICPECERSVNWHDINKHWYICNTCVDQLMHGDMNVRIGIGREGSASEAPTLLDRPEDLISSIRGK